MENLIKAEHLRRYVKEADHRAESGKAVYRIIVGATIQSESKSAINYILGGPYDDQY